VDYILKQKNENMNNKYYLPNPTIYYIRHLGFHYSIDAENYIMIFPILKYKGRPTLFCKLIYNILDNRLSYDIIKPNKDPLALYYNNKFGNAEDFIKKIDSIVHRRIRTMGFKKKMKHVNKKQKEKKD
jgi:hypothetical protein